MKHKPIAIIPILIAFLLFAAFMTTAAFNPDELIWRELVIY